MDLLSKTFFYGWPRIQNLHFEFYPRQTRGWNCNNSRFYSLQLLLLQKEKQNGDEKGIFSFSYILKLNDPQATLLPLIIFCNTSCAFAGSFAQGSKVQPDKWFRLCHRWS